MPITNELVMDAIAVMRRNPANYVYFFENLTSPSWLEPLSKRDFFKDPPETIRERDPERGAVFTSFPPWPESRYLAKVAGIDPDRVLRVMLELDDTDNASVHTDLAEAACAMPAGQAAKWAVREAKWVSQQDYLYQLLPDRLGKLIEHLARGGETQAALSLAGSILTIKPSAVVVADDPDEWPDARARPRPRCEDYTYGEILKNRVPHLVAAAGDEALVLLCNVLNSALEHVAPYHQQRDQAFSQAFGGGKSRRRRAQREEPPKLRADSSWSWRRHIHTNGRSSRDPESLLVSAIRDAAGQLIERKLLTVQNVVELLEQYSWKVFHRISLHALRMYPDSAEKLIVERLIDGTEFGYHYLPNEYDLLLRDYFPKASAAARQKILDFIEERVSLDEIRVDLSQFNPRPSQQEVLVQAHRWKIDRLHLIQSTLPVRWQQRYADLAALKGLEGYKPRDPEHVWTPTVSHPGSPKSREELARMNVGEIVHFLRTWDSPSWDESPYALGRDLSGLVKTDPQRFAQSARDFRCIDATYVREFIWGLREATQRGHEFDWEPVLDLCDWVVAQPHEIPGRRPNGLPDHKDPHWGWAFKAVVDLLRAGLESGKTEIPFAHRSRVWQLISILAEDPEPTPAYEAKEHNSPQESALSTTRGSAMNAVVEYALWVHRNVVKQPNEVWRGFKQAPEVQKVLDRHLRPRHDPALGIRAVYGEHVPALDYLDREWTCANLPRIFPRDERRRDYWNAAWDSFIEFAEPGADLFHRLEGEYRRAIEKFSATTDKSDFGSHPGKRLAEELMLFYWHGELDLESPKGLLSTFHREAPDSLRAHAVETVGMKLQNKGNQVTAEISQRLKHLWVSRLQEARIAEDSCAYKKELAAFGWWFASGRFEDDWALEQLAATIQLGVIVDDMRLVAERLANLAPSMPVRVARALNLMVDLLDYIGVYSLADGAREALSAILDSCNEEAKELAQRTIDRLLSLGHRNFRDLIRQTQPQSLDYS